MSENVPSGMCAQRRYRSAYAFLGAFWIVKDAPFLYAGKWDSDQTVWIRRLIWFFVGPCVRKFVFARCGSSFPVLWFPAMPITTQPGYQDCVQKCKLFAIALDQYSYSRTSFGRVIQGKTSLSLCISAAAQNNMFLNVLYISTQLCFTILLQDGERHAEIGDRVIFHRSNSILLHNRPAISITRIGESRPKDVAFDTIIYYYE